MLTIAINGKALYMPKIIFLRRGIKTTNYILSRLTRVVKIYKCFTNIKASF